MPLAGREAGDKPLVGRCSAGPRLAEQPCTLLAKLDGIGSGIFLGTAALDETPAGEPRDEVGHRGPVDAGALDELGLVQPFLVADHHHHRELARRQSAGARLGGKYFGGALAGAVKQMCCRTVKVFSELSHLTQIPLRRVGRVILRCVDRTLIKFYTEKTGPQMSVCGDTGAIVVVPTVVKVIFSLRAKGNT